MKKYLAVTGLFLALVFSFVAFRVYGQQRLSLVAFPATQDKDVELGGQAHLQVHFKNDDNSFITGNVKVADYVITDKQGGATLVEEGQPKPKYAASSWITLPMESITIPPKDVVTVDLFVDVPQDVPSCGSYAVVYFQPALPGKGEVASNLNSASGVTAKIGALINFHVQGKECRENLVISKFETLNFQEFGPVKLNMELLNSSDIDMRPKGIINLTNVFGGYVDSQKIRDLRIFPETIKAYEAKLGNRWMVGRYKVSLAATYGTDNKKLTATTYIWVIPWRIGLIVLLSIIIILLLIRSIVNRSKKARLNLEEQLGEEKSEIEKLKEQLRKRTT